MSRVVVHICSFALGRKSTKLVTFDTVDSLKATDKNTNRERFFDCEADVV